MILLDIENWDLVLHPKAAMTIILPPVGSVKGLVCIEGELVVVAGAFAYRLRHSNRWSKRFCDVTRAIVAQADEGIVSETLVPLVRLP